MSLASRHCKEDLTHWTDDGDDTYGGRTWGTPVIVKGRWEELDMLENERISQEKTSNATVYLVTDVVVGDYLARGDKTATSNPTTLDGAWKVLHFQRVTDLSNLDTIRRAEL